MTGTHNNDVILLRIYEHKTNPIGRTVLRKQTLSAYRAEILPKSSDIPLCRSSALWTEQCGLFLVTRVYRTNGYVLDIGLNLPHRLSAKRRKGARKSNSL